MSAVPLYAALALLGLALVIPTVLGLVTPYVILVIALGTLITLLATRQGPAIWRESGSRLMLIAWLLLVALYAYTAQAPRDVLSAVNFIMLPLFGPLCLLFQHMRARIPATLPARLALIGLVLTVLMGLWFQLRVLSPEDRTRAFNLGPIVAANATFALAVIAGTLAFLDRRRRTLLVPLTILAGIVVALMGTARGPLIGVPPLLLFTLIMLWRYRTEARRLIAGGFVAVLAGGAAVLAVLGSERVAKLPQIISNLVSGSASGDYTTELRLTMYRAGWRAFLDAPILGHGWARLTKAPRPYFDPTYAAEASRYNQLHNDLLDFAVSGGVVGVLVYVLIVSAPLVAAWRSPADSMRPARLYATGGLLIVYVCAGFTDLMFGHEYHTTLFVTLNAITLGLLAPPAKPASA